MTAVAHQLMGRARACASARNQQHEIAMSRHPLPKRLGALCGLSLLPLVAIALPTMALLRHLQREPGRPQVAEIAGLIGTRHHSGPMAFGPDGRSLALPKRVGGRVEVWNLQTRGVRVLTSSLNEDRSAADRVAFSHGGRFLSVYFRGKGTAIWDLPADKEICQIPVAPGNWVDAMAFSDEDRTLVTVMGKDTATNTKASLWNYSAARWELATAAKSSGHTFDPQLLFRALSPDGRFIVLQQEDVGQIVFDLKADKMLFALRARGGFCFSSDGSALVSYHGDEIHVWDGRSGGELKHLTLKPAYSGATDQLALSPNGMVLAVGAFRRACEVGLINLATGELIAAFECCPSSMLCDAVCFSPDGRILATDTFDVDSKDRDVDPILRFWAVPGSR